MTWDGVPRVDTWLTTYMSADDAELNRAIGMIALVAMVRRARQPGVKFDQIITMESKEGFQKSTALAVLAGAPENFSDQTILGRSDKEQQELLRGVWVYEI
ncbi:MAG TPA: VapE domain-containing protein, partial [Gemmataceae bacterium]|nr:VapE domain-containing protein [Gemmataceae bacterium]